MTDGEQGESPDSMNPTKPQTSLIKKLSLVTAFIVLVFTITTVLMYGYYLSELNKPIESGESTVEFTINKGDSVDKIARKFVDEGYIKRPEFLKVYLLFNPDKVIQAGRYRIKMENLNFISLIDQLQNGSFEKRLTFIEGWRIEEYIDYLAKEMGVDFARKFEKSELAKEGYMFPDTYIIEEDYLAENLASWMRNNFDKKFTQELVGQAALRDLTMEEVIILASILEREMNIEKDRPVVAGILIKRWRNGWPIQADATIQYAMGTEKDWWPTVLRADYKTFESPYNTYLNKGLPPGPIANPGLDSIEAVINYKESPYWFYITGKDGITRFAETLEEHNLNVSKFL